MEKELPARPRDEEPPARDDVRVAGNRCPYCHDEVAKEAADVCRDCLARHHGGCWIESGRCGACGSEYVLRPVRPALTAERVRELLRQQGHTDEEIAGVLGPPGAEARCVWAGCTARGVARGNLGPHLYCRVHAHSQRTSLLVAGAFIALLGVATVVGGVAWAIAEGHPVPLVLTGAGAMILALGVWMSRVPRGLPPLEGDA